MDPITSIGVASAKGLATNQGTIDYVLDRFFDRKDWYFRKEQQHKIQAEIIQLEKSGDLEKNLDKYIRYTNLIQALNEGYRMGKVAEIREKTASYLSLLEIEVPKTEPRQEFAQAFAKKIDEIPDIESIKDTWAKLLSAEISNPGKISVRTLSVLQNITSNEATLFTKLLGGLNMQPKSILRIYNSERNTLPGLMSYAEMIDLRDAGLVINEHDTIIVFNKIKATVGDYLKLKITKDHPCLSDLKNDYKVILIGN